MGNQAWNHYVCETRGCRTNSKKAPSSPLFFRAGIRWESNATVCCPNCGRRMRPSNIGGAYLAWDKRATRRTLDDAVKALKERQQAAADDLTNAFNRFAKLGLPLAYKQLLTKQQLFLQEQINKAIEGKCEGQLDDLKQLLIQVAARLDEVQLRM
eukprot:NODE_5240_length_600_cov_146.724771.p1 GENE.NODE_5240_length_600_cov_146.724771~~NODE_5240_length_600_cov_146.724771.p1  ORF type:complete len:155 (+),score=51.14 NODE_5240_length_600_cov_146.724771:3-467(+)